MAGEVCPRRPLPRWAERILRELRGEMRIISAIPVAASRMPLRDRRVTTRRLLHAVRDVSPDALSISSPRTVDDVLRVSAAVREECEEEARELRETVVARDSRAMCAWWKRLRGVARRLRAVQGAEEALEKLRAYLHRRGDLHYPAGPLASERVRARLDRIFDAFDRAAGAAFEDEERCKPVRLAGDTPEAREDEADRYSAAAKAAVETSATACVDACVALITRVAQAGRVRLGRYVTRLADSREAAEEARLLGLLRRAASRDPCLESVVAATHVRHGSAVSAPLARDERPDPRVALDSLCDAVAWEFAIECARASDATGMQPFFNRSGAHRTLAHVLRTRVRAPVREAAARVARTEESLEQAARADLKSRLEGCATIVRDAARVLADCRRDVERQVTDCTERDAILEAGILLNDAQCGVADVRPPAVLTPATAALLLRKLART